MLTDSEIVQRFLAMVEVVKKMTPAEIQSAKRDKHSYSQKHVYDIIFDYCLNKNAVLPPVMQCILDGKHNAEYTPVDGFGVVFVCKNCDHSETDD